MSVLPQVYYYYYYFVSVCVQFIGLLCEILATAV